MPSETPTFATVATASPASAAPVVVPSAAPAQQSGPAPAPGQHIAPGTPEWAALTTEQRHAALRGPENPRARGHSPAVEQREAAAARTAGEQPQPDQGVDDLQAPTHSTEKLRVGKYEVSEAELAGMLDRQSQDDLRKATVPPSPDAYELKISPDAKLPGNVEFKFDGNDPSLVAARNWAHSRGLDQSAFSEMLTLYASHVAGQNAALAARSQQEIAKAGVNAPQRVDAVGKWITGEMGEADAAPIKATIVTDAHLRFYERMMQKVSSQGAASFSQQHRAAPETDSIPGYEKMSFEQRRQAQDQNAARRNSR
jgi:hypothetical protein